MREKSDGHLKHRIWNSPSTQSAQSRCWSVSKLLLVSGISTLHALCSRLYQDMARFHGNLNSSAECLLPLRSRRRGVLCIAASRQLGA